MRMRGMGAQVTVTEVDPVRGLEAVMDGFMVDSIAGAVKYGEVFVTATGNKQVIGLKQLKAMKDGAIVANAGHFNVEFDYQGIKDAAKKVRLIRPNLVEFSLSSGKRLYVLAEGRLINLVGAEGHPAEVMDMSFADQALAAEYFVEHKGKLEPTAYVLPQALAQRAQAQA